MKKYLCVLCSAFFITAAFGAGSEHNIYEMPHIVMNTMDTGTTISLSISRDDSFLYSADAYAGTIKCWDVASGRLLRIWNGFKYIQKMDMSADGKMFCARLLNSTLVLDAATGSVLCEFKQQYTCSAFSKDGALLALGRTSSYKPLKTVNPVS
ncbi:MAG TPA: hypothetical protein VF857_08630, partial [Spirochaetota bacterium]